MGCVAPTQNPQSQIPLFTRTATGCTTLWFYKISRDKISRTSTDRYAYISYKILWELIYVRARTRTPEECLRVRLDWVRTCLWYCWSVVNYVSLRLKDKNQLNAELTVVARSPFLENISPSLRIDFYSSPIVLSFATDIRRLVWLGMRRN